MNPFTKTTAAALAFTIIATGSMAVSTQQAQAGNGKLIGGVIAGLVVGSAIVHHNRHSTRRCWWEDQVRYDRYGNPYYREVKVCTR